MKLSDAQIAQVSALLPGWTHDDSSPPRWQNPSRPPAFQIEVCRDGGHICPLGTGRLRTRDVPDYQRFFDQAAAAAALIEKFAKEQQP